MRVEVTCDIVQTVCRDNFCNGCKLCLVLKLTEVQCACGWCGDSLAYTALPKRLCPDCGEGLEDAVDEAMCGLQWSDEETK